MVYKKGCAKQLCTNEVGETYQKLNHTLLPGVTNIRNQNKMWIDGSASHNRQREAILQQVGVFKKIVVPSNFHGTRIQSHEIKQFIWLIHIF